MYLKTLNFNDLFGCTYLITMNSKILFNINNNIKNYDYLYLELFEPLDVKILNKKILLLFKNCWALNLLFLLSLGKCQMLSTY